MISAVPITGSSAAVPGYGVLSPICVHVTRISARPPQPTSAVDGPGRCRHAPAVNATSPPTANSHARVGSEKNAHDGQFSVHAIDTANDTAANSPSTNTYGVTDRAPDTPGRPRQNPSGADDQRRPQQIELLFHTQRPVVL